MTNIIKSSFFSRKCFIVCKIMPSHRLSYIIDTFNKDIYHSFFLLLSNPILFFLEFLERSGHFIFRMSFFNKSTKISQQSSSNRFLNSERVFMKSLFFWNMLHSIKFIVFLSFKDQFMFMCKVLYMWMRI
jgi:hypothetical protein